MMEAAIQDWLRREADREAAHSAVFAAGCLLLGIVVLAVTYGVLVAVIYGVLHTIAVPLSVRVPGGTALFLGVPTVAGLFWLNAQVARSHLAASRQKEEGLLGEEAPRRGVPVVGSLLAYPGGSPFWGADVVLCGPRLVSQAMAHLRRMHRLRRMDDAGGALVVSILLAHGKRMPLRALAAKAALPDPLLTFTQLRDLPGVLLLSRPPPALTLTSEYREALAEVADLEQAPASSPEVFRAAAAVRSLHELLGLAPHTTATEARNIAAQQLARYQAHVIRRVAPELEGVAEDHARAVREALGRFEEEPKVSPEAPDPRQVWETHRPPRQ